MQTLTQLADAVDEAIAVGDRDEQTDAVAALIAGVRAAEQSPAGGMAKQNFSTSEAGRKFVADFFANTLRRHDFTRYINEKLAADFACVLAGALSGMRPSVDVARTEQSPATEQSREAVALSDKDISAMAKANMRLECHVPIYSFNAKELSAFVRRIVACSRPQPAPAVPDIDAVMWAVDEYAASTARVRLESLYGTSQSYVDECYRHQGEARAKLYALLTAAPQPAQQRTITDDELLDAFWQHAEVKSIGTISGLVDGLRAVEKLVVPQPNEGGE